jgi:hypothetical protein
VSGHKECTEHALRASSYPKPMHFNCCVNFVFLLLLLMPLLLLILVFLLLVFSCRDYTTSNSVFLKVPACPEPGDRREPLTG